MATDLREMVRRFYEEVENQGHFDVAEELFASNFRDVHNSSPRAPIEGIDGIKRLAAALREEMNIRITVEDLIVEGDKVVARISSRSTPKGNVMGVPANGREFRSEGVEIFRVAGGKFVERWVFIDQMPMLRELGVVPSPQRA